MIIKENSFMSKKINDAKYNHQEVLEENTRPSTPQELRNLRIFAGSLIGFFVVVFFLFFKYVPVNNERNRIASYRMS
jgi:hypothetical protein